MREVECVRCSNESHFVGFHIPMQDSRSFFSLVAGKVLRPSGEAKALTGLSTHVYTESLISNARAGRLLPQQVFAPVGGPAPATAVAAAELRRT